MQQAAYQRAAGPVAYPPVSDAAANHRTRSIFAGRESFQLGLVGGARQQQHLEQEQEQGPRATRSTRATFSTRTTLQGGVPPTRFASLRARRSDPALSSHASFASAFANIAPPPNSTTGLPHGLPQGLPQGLPTSTTRTTTLSILTRPSTGRSPPAHSPSSLRSPSSPFRELRDLCELCDLTQYNPCTRPAVRSLDPILVPALRKSASFNSNLRASTAPEPEPLSTALGFGLRGRTSLQSLTCAIRTRSTVAPDHHHQQQQRVRKTSAGFTSQRTQRGAGFEEAIQGVMTESRTALIAWVNNLLQTNFTRIEQLGSGAAYCQIFDSLFGDVQMTRVKFDAKQEYEYINNFKALQNCFLKHKIDKPIPVERLVKCRMQDNIEFLQWVKKFHDNHTSGAPYDALGRRGNAAMGSTPKPVVGPGPGASARRLGSNPTTRSNTGPIAPRTSARSNGPTRAGGMATSAATQKQITTLSNQVQELTMTVESLEHERDFYFGKLRSIEILIQSGQAGEEGMTLEELCKRVQEVLYQTEEGFEIPDPQGGAVQDNGLPAGVVAAQAGVGVPGVPGVPGMVPGVGGMGGMGEAYAEEGNFETF